MDTASSFTPLLTCAEVAARFRVDPKTVTRWARAGRLDCIKTLGGHRRYFAVQVEQVFRGEAVTPARTLLAAHETGQR